MKPFKFRCNYCDKKYKLESAFLKHTCKERTRSEAASSLHGIRSYEFYKKWNTMQGRHVPDVSQFLVSSVYTPMMRFSKFAKKVNLPDTDTYIKLMIEQGINPSAWVNDLAYSHYINYVDRRLSAQKQVDITVNTMLDVVEEHDEDIREFFNIITANHFLQLVVQRKLSPWILYNSTVFLDFHSKILNSHQKSMFETICPAKEWRAKFDTKPDQVKMAKGVVAELGV